MSISRKTPDDLLINRDFLLSTIREDRRLHSLRLKISAEKNSAFSYGATLLSTITALLPHIVAQNWNSWEFIVFGLASIVAFFFLLSAIKDWYSAKTDFKEYVNTDDAEDILINKVKEEIRYTAILAIAYHKQKDTQLSFLTIPKDHMFLAHCAMDPTLGCHEQDALITNYLTTAFGIESNNIRSIIPINDEPQFSIKPINGKIQLNAFIMYKVKLRKRTKSSLCNFKGMEWITINEMRENPEAMSRNLDVINMLESYQHVLEDSFEDKIGPFHIIWNITNQCEYHCKICATHDKSRKELDIGDKHKVLNSICTAKNKIRILDFAGGDPCLSSESLSVIESAINALSPDNVSVTTTGKGLERLGADKRTKLLKQCEITVDASHDNLTKDKTSKFSRGELAYCTNNIEQIHTFSETLEKVVINIPILDDTLNDTEIATLLGKINSIINKNPKLDVSCQLLRLMPVGAQSLTGEKEAYLKYNPLCTAEKIFNALTSQGINCKYHCSLRVLQGTTDCVDGCNMLNRKIGIDCAGNVFACAWAAYLSLDTEHNIEKNPFYLGNLLKTDLIKLLDDNKGSKTKAYTQIIKDVHNQVKKDFCSVISVYNSGSLSDNHDPLSPTYVDG